jgi:hypothetical protein
MTWSARIEHTPTADIQVERIGEKNGHPCFVVVIDGQVHFAWRDAEEPGQEDELQSDALAAHPLCCDCSSCLNGDHHDQG